MALKKWLHPYGNVAKGKWNLVRVMNFYKNSSQLVYKCTCPAGLAQSRWQRPGSSSNSSGPPWHTAVLEPALGQDTACLHLGQVRKEKPVEGSCKGGGCSQSRSKGPRQFLSDFGSPTDALHGLLTNISLAFPSPSSSPQNPLFLHVEKTQK